MEKIETKRLFPNETEKKIVAVIYYTADRGDRSSICQKEIFFPLLRAKFLLQRRIIRFRRSAPSAFVFLFFKENYLRDVARFLVEILGILSNFLKHFLLPQGNPDRASRVSSPFSQFPTTHNFVGLNLSASVERSQQKTSRVPGP